MRTQPANPTPLTMTVPMNDVHYLEVVASDPEAARGFYSSSFGWEFEGPIPELGGAYLAELPGGSLCGIRGSMNPQETPTVRTYVRVEDVERATQQAEELGATIALGPTELPGRGRIAIYIVEGVQQGIWQVD